MLFLRRYEFCLLRRVSQSRLQSSKFGFCHAEELLYQKSRFKIVSYYEFVSSIPKMYVQKTLFSKRTLMFYNVNATHWEKTIRRTQVKFHFGSSYYAGRR